jgi:serine/threonine-protein kinase
VLGRVSRSWSGVVHAAVDLAAHSQVAIKVWFPAAVSAHAREVQALLRLAGPGVVRMRERCGRCLVLDWAEQGSLRDAIRRGDQALALHPARWALPLARTLARIHDAGYVHGDLKPSNLLLSGSGEPWLCDFELASPIGSVIEGGSTRFAPPDAGAGTPSHPRDDVYGFGRLLDDLPVTIRRSGLILVLISTPGMASALAQAIDQSGLEEQEGTLAGDNTVLVLFATEERLLRWQSRLEAMRGRTVLVAPRRG